MMMSKKAYIKSFTSLIGLITYGYQSDAVLCISIGDSSLENVEDELYRLNYTIEPGDQKIGKSIEKELNQYFKGSLHTFSIPFQLFGTPFQTKVWYELHNIPFGQLISYKELAELAGYPNAYRAVGTTMAHNRLPIIIPCHRVISSGGKLGGFSGGLEKKRFLLQHEGILL